MGLACRRVKLRTARREQLQRNPFTPPDVTLAPKEGLCHLPIDLYLGGNLRGGIYDRGWPTVMRRKASKAIGLDNTSSINGEKAVSGRRPRQGHCLRTDAEEGLRGRSFSERRGWLLPLRSREPIRRFVRCPQFDADQLFRPAAGAQLRVDRSQRVCSSLRFIVLSCCTRISPPIGFATPVSSSPARFPGRSTASALSRARNGAEPSG